LLAGGAAVADRITGSVEEVPDMQVFLDTAKLDEVREVLSLGFISGVTTNPNLMMQSGRTDWREVVREICYLVQGHVSAEVLSTEVEGMVAEAKEIATWSPYVGIKIPATPSGLGAISRLSKEEVDLERLCRGCAWYGKCYTGIDRARELAEGWGIQTNGTLVFSPNQALFAARAGASFVSPFVGRLDEVGQDGMQLVADVVSIFRAYDIETRVVAASLRHPLHVTQAALAGADAATVHYPVLMKALRHPLTDLGVERFRADWAKLKG
jgi:transaldolase